MYNIHNQSTMSTTTKECPICVETFNKSTRVPVVCPYKGCICCKSCFNNFLLTSGLTPKCMSCSSYLTDDDIHHISTKVFFDKFTDHKIGLLINMKKADLPELQERVVNPILKQRKFDVFLESIQDKILSTNMDGRLDKITMKLIKHFKTFEISVKQFKLKRVFNVCRSLSFGERICCICYTSDYLSNVVMINCNNCSIKCCKSCFRLNYLLNKDNCINCNSNDLIGPFLIENQTQSYQKLINTKNTKKNIKDIGDEVRDIIKKKIAFNEDVIKLSDSIVANTPRNFNHIAPKTKTAPKTAPIKKCPTDGCRMFLSPDMSCLSCEITWCKKCMREDGEDHECNEDEVETIKELEKNSKPCPKCGMPISRIDGCSQVWTPCCKIAFDWNTGEIDNGRVHSPEYYAYMRRNNIEIIREREENYNCDNIVSWNDIYNATRDTVIKIDDEYMKMTHYRQVVLRTLPPVLREIDVEDLQVKYLLKEISDDDWHKTMKKQVKKHNFEHALYLIIDMYTKVVNDMLKNVLVDKDFEGFRTRYKDIVEYTNEHIEKTLKRYNSNAKGYYVK